MLESIKNINAVKRIRKTMWYSRLRQYLPMPQSKFVDDRDELDIAEVVKIEWPSNIIKPVFGIVQDDDRYPKWTKYRRFLDNNSFNYSIFPIHQHDWIEQAQKFDIIIGIPNNLFYTLQEVRSKFEIIEKYLRKSCYPTAAHVRLYEDKCLEAHISKATGIPFAKTFVSHDQVDAFHLIEDLKFPFVSKIVPSSGSQGVELVRDINKAREIIKQVFSISGRKTHLISYRQKDFIYFQEYIPNDGYDYRVIVVGNWVFGFDRKVPLGDFRASGMHIVENRALSEESMRIALKVNEIIQSPVLAVDMLRGLDGKYTIIEFSPLYQMDSPGELQVDGVPGVYVFDEDGSYHFEKGRYWVAELALREFLLHDYLPKTK